MAGHPRATAPSAGRAQRALTQRSCSGWPSNRRLAGTAWHAVADEGDAVRDIATVIGRRLGLPVQPVPQETFCPFGPIFAMDQPASSARTRDALGWQPTHPSLLEDLENIQP